MSVFKRFFSSQVSSRPPPADNFVTPIENSEAYHSLSDIEEQAPSRVPIRPRKVSAPADSLDHDESLDRVSSLLPSRHFSNKESSDSAPPRLPLLHPESSLGVSPFPESRGLEGRSESGYSATHSHSRGRFLSQESGLRRGLLQRRLRNSERNRRWVPLAGARMRKPPKRVVIFLACMVVIFLCSFVVWIYADIVPWKLISIPVVSVLFTWFHIWLALQMCFFPTEFVGLWCDQEGRGLGWQGIVPRKAAKMAGIACDLMLNRLVKVDEILEKLDGERLYEFLISTGVLRSAQAEVNRKICDKWLPRVWPVTPWAIKTEMVNLQVEESKGILLELIEEAKVVVSNPVLFDAEEMIVTAFVDDRKMLSEFFLKIGRKEILFLEFSGAIMGLLCGLVQLVLYALLVVSARQSEEAGKHPPPPPPSSFWGGIESFFVGLSEDHNLGSWVLFPLVGLIVGNLTNFLAIQMIFRPVNPVDVVNPFTKRKMFQLQGLFLKRQSQVAQVYSELISKNVLHCRSFFRYMKTTRGWPQLLKVHSEVVGRAVDRWVGESVKGLLEVAGQGEKLKELKEDIIRELQIELSHEPYIRLYEQFLDKEMRIKETLAHRLVNLAPTEFEQMLHPIFQEDELTLILLGGFLGFLVGIVQVAVFGL